MWRWKTRLNRAPGIAVATLMVVALAQMGTISVEPVADAAVNPNPCALVSVPRIDAELAKGAMRPKVKETHGGFPGNPVLVCTYSWGAETLVIRLISDTTEYASGGVHEPGMGPHGLLLVSSSSILVAFTKLGWSVWTIAKPPTPDAGVVAIGQFAYRVLH